MLVLSACSSKSSRNAVPASLQAVGIDYFSVTSNVDILIDLGAVNPELNFEADIGNSNPFEVIQSQLRLDFVSLDPSLTLTNFELRFQSNPVTVSVQQDVNGLTFDLTPPIVIPANSRQNKLEIKWTTNGSGQNKLLQVELDPQKQTLLVRSSNGDVQVRSGQVGTERGLVRET